MGVTVRFFRSKGEAPVDRWEIGAGVPFGTTEFAMPADTWVDGYTHLLVYLKTPLVEASTPATFRFEDVFSTVSNITFPDLDLDAGDLGGQLAWLPPDDVSQVTHYVVHLGSPCNASGDPAALPEPQVPICERSYYTNVSVGVESFTVPPDTLRESHTHLAVYTMSSLFEQTTPWTHLIFDADASVTDVFFQGKDLDLLDLGGVVTWTQPSQMERVDTYVLYLAESAAGSAKSQIEGEIQAGVNRADVPAETPALEYSHFTVFTKSVLVEQTTPSAIQIVNEFSRVDDVTFIDDDLDEFELGGDLVWVAPPDDTEVTDYLIYFANSEAGDSRSLIATVSSTTLTHLVPNDTPLQGYTHFVIYARSSLVEQTTPAFVLIVDAAASVSGITYLDKDLDPEEIGGVLSWTPPDAPHLARVVVYRLYMAETADGAVRSQLETDLAAGTNQVTIPPETPQGSYTQLVVYTKSALAEQTTPVAFGLVDVEATRSMTNVESRSPP